MPHHPDAEVSFRPMTTADAADVVAVVDAADRVAALAAHEDPPQHPPEVHETFVTAMASFPQRDPDGAWVAERDGAVVGMAESVRRDDFWGLSMLFVHPDVQGQGVGRRLLERTLAYAEGARIRMILTSRDPRAVRRYSRAGLAIHPAVNAKGVVDRSTLPAAQPGREGGVDDLDLVAEVDAGLRGSRAADVEWSLSRGTRMVVVDEPSGRGYAAFRDDGVRMLGATDEATAERVLWRALAESSGEFSVSDMTAQQDWAVRVCLAAGLAVTGSGPLFVAGMPLPPGPWLPNGWFF